MTEKSSPAPQSQITQWILWGIWALTMVGMLAYSGYATVDTIIVYGKIPDVDVKNTAMEQALDKYGKASYYVTRWRMVKALTKNCEKLKEANMSYADTQDVAMYRHFMRLHSSGQHEQAKTRMDKAFQMAKDRDIKKMILTAKEKE